MSRNTNFAALLATFALGALSVHASPTVDKRLEMLENKISVTANQNGYGTPVSLTQVTTNNTTLAARATLLESHAAAGDAWQSVQGSVDISSTHTLTLIAPFTGVLKTLYVTPNLEAGVAMAGTSAAMTVAVNGVTVSGTLTLTSSTANTGTSTSAAINTSGTTQNVTKGDKLVISVGSGLTNTSASTAPYTQTMARAMLDISATH